MDLLHSSACRFPTSHFLHLHRPSPPLRRLGFTVRSSLPFPDQNAKYHRELQAAVDVVERACRICVDVKKYLLTGDRRILEKNDQTPVTVADFGVQALISLELSKLFPSIPLVAEEDSASLRSNNLVTSVVNTVTDKTSFREKQLTEADVLEAIDRGGKDAFSFGPMPATYWILDPIDGTRGFVRGGDALYVVGLALVVEGEIVLGVMGCPNWQEDNSSKSTKEALESAHTLSESGIIMVSHIGCGTWTKQLSDGQTWDSLPLSTSFDATTDAESINDKLVLLLPACCGSLCKYLMVACGRASVFILRKRAQTIVQAWDHAVGMICVHEAGGKVTDWRGSQLDLAADQVDRRFIYPSGGVLVANSSLHSKLLELISSSSSVV
ncbi:putative PAP-specific phosphatase, mitochondrial isoform X2 [Camellia sinensis]|uniref:putative PAP-specific phosphatase, mitochondrial isoform X2 n=1 Tax=Camellia sinensis TaxID=4442 RepID=UPI001036D1FF|nr:putative PAP-specific phosphatase, mitochondrial isoform X2 [Camellia sinensis]